MKYVDADKIAVALGKMPTWPDFDVRGESGNAPYCVCCCNTDESECREDTHEGNIPDRLLREAETIYEEMVKKGRAVMPSTVGVVQRKNTTVVNWDDGVKTVVTLKPDDCPDKMFVGFCIAYTKRMLGGTTKLLETIERCDTDKHVRLLREASKKFRKQRDLDRKEVDRIRREKKYKEMVDEEFMRLRAVEEAKNIIFAIIRRNDYEKASCADHFLGSDSHILYWML